MRIRLQHRQAHPALSRQKLTPLEEGGIAHEFESLAVVDVAVEIEMIMERGMG